MTRLSPEVQAAIVKVAGKWALSIATAPHPSERISTQPSEVSSELERHFDWAFKYLSTYIEGHASVSK